MPSIPNFEEINMAEVISVGSADAEHDDTGEVGRSGYGRLAPAAMVATVLGWVLAPQTRSERGFSSVEYIFGIILVVALISVFITVVKDDSTIDLIKGVMAWALKLNKLLGWD
jgi:hypothetical protein